MLYQDMENNKSNVKVATAIKNDGFRKHEELARNHLNINDDKRLPSHALLVLRNAAENDYMSFRPTPFQPLQFQPFILSTVCLFDHLQIQPRQIRPI